ncbi:MAG: FAD:protein FMN transferase, partial [Ketobacteraceae bacterium]|nr:FAD:protein FMN transferase [Ketobacteraceae bacterium]
MIARSYSRTLWQPVILGLLVLWVAGCDVSEDPRSAFHTFNGPTMGTWYNVKIQGLPESLTGEQVKAAIEAELNSVNEKMSTYRQDSELSEFNRAPVNQRFPLSTDTREVLAISQQVYQESGGAFDITVGPLVNL